MKIDDDLIDLASSAQPHQVTVNGISSSLTRTFESKSDLCLLDEGKSKKMNFSYTIKCDAAKTGPLLIGSDVIVISDRCGAQVELSHASGCPASSNQYLLGSLNLALMVVSASIILKGKKLENLLWFGCRSVPPAFFICYYLMS